MNKKSIFKCLLVLLTLVVHGSGEKPEVSLVEYEPTYGTRTLPFIARDLDFLAGLVDRISNPACKSQCREVLGGLKNLTSWALEFYDASGKLPVGVLAGSTYHLGNFDECMKIGREQGIGGRYCLSNVRLELPENLEDFSILKKFRKFEKRYDMTIDEMHWGICVPEACTNEDVAQVMDIIFSNTLAGSKFGIMVNITESNCHRDETKTPSTADRVYLYTILTITAIIITGTAYHAFFYNETLKEPTSIFAEVLLAFSLILNWKKLISPAHEELNIECISGIKFFSMLFIIASHTLIFVVSGPVLNEDFWSQAIGKVENSIFLNSPLLVDTFLLLSGFLFARILLQEMDKRKSINFLVIYLARYIRLTPAYMVMVGLYMTWLPRLDSGPLWSRMIAEQERCAASWWTNILYINNYVHTDKICMFQSWYLSVDTQLFVLAPMVIYPLWRWRKAGHVILGTSLIVSTILPFVITWINEWDPTLLIYTREVKDISTNNYFKQSYIKTHMRAGAYCFGLLFGYLVYRIQNSDTKLSTVTVRTGWLVGSCFMVVSMCSINIFYGARKDFTTVEAAFYSSIHRAMWSAGVGWVLLACITDNSGPIRNFLKWRLFVPLSRLTYAAYLVNGLVELHSASTIRTPQYLDNFSLFSKVLSHFMLTFLGAVILSTMFESPILGLERIFLRRERKASSTFVKKSDSLETTVTVA